VTRADIVIVTKTPERLTNIELKMIGKDLQLLSSQKLFFSYLKYGNLFHFRSSDWIIDIAKELFQYRVFLFSGIASDRNIVTYLKEFANDLKVKNFPDHHFFSKRDLSLLKKEFDSIPGDLKIMVTTEKDLMRLNSLEVFEIVKDWPIFVLPVEVDFKSKNEEFNQIILNYVGSNK
jgi:tetraacyldisaccharide 4'-kinase